jgi:hypothetical protein
MRSFQLSHHRLEQGSEFVIGFNRFKQRLVTMTNLTPIAPVQIRIIETALIRAPELGKRSPAFIPDIAFPIGRKGDLLRTFTVG